MQFGNTLEVEYRVYIECKELKLEMYDLYLPIGSRRNG